MVTSIINSLSTIYGGTILLIGSQGKIHEYLGMTFDYTTKGEVKVTMHDYINVMIDNIPEFWKNEIRMATPALNSLNETR